MGSLPTALKMVRETNHPNYRVMLDTYHFWGGISKFEDLDLLRDGELHHLHFEDVPADPPREIQGQPHRVFPGEGIAPLRRIVQALKAKKYAGPASFESFTPEIQAMDPYQLAVRVRKGFLRIMTVNFKVPCVIDAAPEKGKPPEIAIRTSWMSDVTISGDAMATVRDSEVRGLLLGKDFTDLVVDGIDLFGGATFRQGPEGSFSKLQLLKCNLFGGSKLVLHRPAGTE